MACTELQAFRTAVEALDQRIIRSPRLDRAMFWRNAIPRATFTKNVGVTKSVLGIKPSEPSDDASLWQAITLDGTTHQPTPTCDTNYEDVNVGFFERTYGPKKRRFRGPVICKENLTFQHNIDAFLNGYEDELGRYTSRVWEFSLRSDYMAFADAFVDYTKYNGPNTLSTLPAPTSDITQDMLDDVATDAINTGAGVPDDNGYVMNGEDGPLFTLYIDMRASARILKNNANRRVDAQFASMGQGANGDLSLWKRIGASRVIGNFRHVTTDIAPRANYVAGHLVMVSPFKNVADFSTNGEMLTDAYKAATYEAAIVVTPTAMTAEVVLPSNWKFPDASNYNGEWNFITGGERICTPAVYDPEHEKGRHFAKIEYAPRPDNPFHAKLIWYKRCATDKAFSYCS